MLDELTLDCKIKVTRSGWLVARFPRTHLGWDTGYTLHRSSEWAPLLGMG